MKIYLAGPDEYSFTEFLKVHMRERSIKALFSYFDLMDGKKTARYVPWKYFIK